ncbi:MAG TPA: nitrate reductase [Opitutaceae bacterium]|nr:nitrate reductase [Opitutaceae bacterium]
MKTVVENLLRAHDGPMTSELVLRPAEFGLGRVPGRLQPASTAKSVCGFCSTGCSLLVHLDESGQAINLTPDPDHPVNLGMACPKGWEALTPLVAHDRATTPLLRNAKGQLEPVSWERAIAEFCSRMKGVQARHGAASVAALSTGQITTEEMALLGALAKFGMGIADLDSNTRQCMATSHVAYKQSFGFDAPPFTYADFEESDLLVFVGANPCIAHPIMWQRVMRNRRNPSTVVIDPRRTETAMAATLHVPVCPGGDLALLYGIAHLLVSRGWIDRDFIAAHTTGFDEFETFLRDFTPARVVADTGVSESTLEQLATLIGTRERVSLWWTMGVNQSHQATRTAQAIINLALMTGQIGRPGTGANSITGQCNAMGSRLFGNATSLIGGHDFANPDHRAHVASVLGLDEKRIPTAASRAYDQILGRIATGGVRALWIVATNTAHSWISHCGFAELRRKLDFLVVQDMYATTETARMADLVLPAAGWGEKEGTFINSERRLGVIRKVSRAPGEALSDFAIFKLIAEGWGCGGMFRQWRDPAAAFAIMRALSAGRPFDIGGIRDYDHIEAEGGIQWPFTSADALVSKFGVRSSEIGQTSDTAQTPNSDLRSPATHERRLFADGRFFTPDGRARFVFDPPSPLPEGANRDYPFVLITGRGSSAQWHTGSRTAKSAVLQKLAPNSAWIEIHPADAGPAGIANGDRVRVSSRRGTTEAAAQLTPSVQRGQVFIPMHFPEVNRLTFPAFDPHSRQPAYKACAVRLERLSQE